MATWAGNKLLRICDNTANVLAIELLAAAHAIEDQRPLKTTPELESVHALVRDRVPFIASDHRLDKPIGALEELVSNGELSSFVPDSQLSSAFVTD